MAIVRFCRLLIALDVLLVISRGVRHFEGSCHCRKRFDWRWLSLNFRRDFDWVAVFKSRRGVIEGLVVAAINHDMLKTQRSSPRAVITQPVRSPRACSELYKFCGMLNRRHNLGPQEGTCTVIMYK